MVQLLFSKVPPSTSTSVPPDSSTCPPLFQPPFNGFSPTRAFNAFIAIIKRLSHHLLRPAIPVKGTSVSKRRIVHSSSFLQLPFAESPRGYTRTHGFHELLATHMYSSPASSAFLLSLLFFLGGARPSLPPFDELHRCPRCATSGAKSRSRPAVVLGGKQELR